MTGSSGSAGSIPGWFRWRAGDPGERWCRRNAGLLAASLDEPEVLDSVARNHVAHCLRCQAELAQLERVRAAMSSLRDELARRAETPGVTELIAGIDEAIDGARRRTGRARAAVAAGLAGVAGAVAGTLVHVRNGRAIAS